MFLQPQHTPGLQAYPHPAFMQMLTYSATTLTARPATVLSRAFPKECGWPQSWPEDLPSCISGSRSFQNYVRFPIFAKCTRKSSESVEKHVETIEILANYHRVEFGVFLGARITKLSQIPGK